MKSPLLLILIALGATAVAQLSVPVWLIARQEQVLRSGVDVFVPCRALDPYDPLRGRYVIVNPRVGEVPLEEGDHRTISPGDTYFLVATSGEDGRYHFTHATITRPDASVPHLKLQASRWQNPDHTIIPALPFRRYYMNAKVAPEAEQVYRDALRSLRRSGEADESRVELRLRVLNGRGSIAEVLIDGIPIEKHIEDRAGSGAR